MLRHFFFAAAVLVALPACSEAQVTKSHGDYKITVASLERTKHWEEQQVRYTADQGGIVLLVHLTISSTKSRVNIDGFKVEDISGKSYESPKISAGVLVGDGESITNSKVIVPFVLPATVESKSFVRGKTSFDIQAMAKQARQKAP